VPGGISSNSSPPGRRSKRYFRTCRLTCCLQMTESTLLRACLRSIVGQTGNISIVLCRPCSLTGCCLCLILGDSEKDDLVSGGADLTRTDSEPLFSVK
jgi:hypothetical protein